MFGHRQGAVHRDDPPPDVRRAIIEPIISRITTDVGGNVTIHLAAGITVSMMPHEAMNITTFAVRLYKAHQCHVAPQMASAWSDYIKALLPGATP